MDIKSIHSKAPTRIDLAGGTLDLWPLYLFLRNPLTINLGISLFAEATIDFTDEKGPQNEGQVVLKSEDQNLHLHFPWSALDTIEAIPPGLQLHYRLLRYFVQKRLGPSFSLKSLPSLHLSTRAQSPAGAGLGGSSTLSIAMIGALATWVSELKKEGPLNTTRDGENFIEIVRDVETTVIQVPAGMQDYYGAMYGGLQALRWGAGVHEHESLDPQYITELEKRILLFYSGHSRNSGINNWALFKGFIDQQDEIREKFEKINSATHHLEEALLARNWQAVGTAIAEEWAVRRTLATGITTPEIDCAFKAATDLTARTLSKTKTAPQASQLAGKICGAGGGGCFFVYLPYEGKNDEKVGSELKPAIQKLFIDQGMRPLDFRGVPHGLEVQVQRA